MKHRSILPHAAQEPAEHRESLLEAPDVVGLAQLWTSQFQHITTLALAGGGGLLVLTETGVVAVSGRWWAALLLLALAAMASMIGQTVIVDEATEGRPPGRSARAMRALALMCFGGSGYMLMRLFM